MKRQRRTKIFTVWLLIAALTLPPLTGVAEADNYVQNGTVGEGVDNAILISPEGGDPAKVLYSGDIAIGSGAEANSYYVSQIESVSTAVGTNAKATGWNSSAFGGNAQATMSESSAFGTNAQATTNGSAFGFQAEVWGADGSAFGHNTYADFGGSAFGSGARALGADTAALGRDAKAVDWYSVALGYNSIAKDRDNDNINEIYVPSGSVAKTIEDTVMGTKGVVSIGNPEGHRFNNDSLLWEKVEEDKFTRKLTGLAAGIEDTDAVNVAQLKALDSITVRYTSADAKDEIILGNSSNTASISNLTAENLAEDGKYAATTGQVYNVGKGTADALGGKFELGENGNITGNFEYRSKPGLNTVQSVFDTINEDVTTNETNIASLGRDAASVLGGNSSYEQGTLKTELTVGDEQYTSVQDALNALNSNDSGSGWNLAVNDTPAKEIPADGTVTLKNGNNLAIIEETDGSYTFGVSDTPTFTSVTIGGADGISISKNADYSLNMGNARLTNLANGTNDGDSVNFGQLKAVSADLGARIDMLNPGGSGTTDDSVVKYDNADKNLITLNKDGNGTVKLTNLTRGDISSSNSTDAVTGGQLHSLGESAAKILGGNFSLTDGELTGSFTVNEQTYGTLQEALDAAAASGSGSGSGTGTGSWTLSVNGEETNIGNGGKFALASGSNVEINKNDAGAYELGVVKNPEFESIKVGNINIREEGINMGGNTITGLANGGIYQGSTDAVTGDQLWNAYRRIDTIDERVQVVGAHAAALSALHPVPYNPYEPTTFSAGFGMYRNEQSVAVGVFHYVRENVLVNAGLSLNSDGDTMGRAGISFAIGKSGRKQPSMVKDVASMQQQMAAMQQMLVELKEENEKNKETIKVLKEALEEKK